MVDFFFLAGPFCGVSRGSAREPSSSSSVSSSNLSMAEVRRDVEALPVGLDVDLAFDLAAFDVSDGSAARDGGLKAFVLEMPLGGMMDDVSGYGQGVEEVQHGCEMVVSCEFQRGRLT